MSTSLEISTVVRRKRRRKHTQPRRKINTSIKKLNSFPLVSTQLMVNTYYSAKGGVTQQRKTCPSCGPGTFMAQHWDRYYCGLCHTTIKMDAETVKKNE
jgi:small subunit ribosomal protein S27Ae